MWWSPARDLPSGRCRAFAKNTDYKQRTTTMRKNYQTRTAPVVTAAEVAVPERVTIAMGELAGAVEEGLLALAVAAGLQVMHTMMNQDVITACGPKGRHDAGRAAVRHGTEAGSVTLGGR